MIANPKKMPLAQDESGATIIEFALVSPVLLFMMMGSFDIGYGVYMRSVLDGAVQKAARDAALESGPGRLAAIDAEVEATIKKLNKNAVVNVTRQSYHQYSDVDRPESFTDSNGNGVCDNNEPFGDENDNGDWDDDVGSTGVGGPKDVVYYTVSVGYDQLFPFSGFQRDASQRVLTGYQEKIVPKMVRVPTEWRQVQVPVYEIRPAQMKNVRIPIYKTVPITGYRDVKLPIYKTVKQDAGKKEMLVPVYSIAGVEKRKVRLPQYEISGDVQMKKVRVPIYATTKVETGKQAVEVPIYRLVERTRSTSKNVAASYTVSVPVYSNVTYTEGGKQKLRRELTGYKTVRRLTGETEKKVDTGTKTYWVRELAGYQTVQRPVFKLVRKFVEEREVDRPVGGKRQLVGYKEVERVVKVDRQLIGYNTVVRPQYRLVRVLEGYKTVKRPIGGERILVGERNVLKAFKQERVQVGTKTIQRPVKFKIVQQGTTTSRVPVYGFKDASFTLDALKKDRQLSSSTVLRNQPYGDQATIATVTLRCT